MRIAYYANGQINQGFLHSVWSVRMDIIMKIKKVVCNVMQVVKLVLRKVHAQVAMLFRFLEIINVNLFRSLLYYQKWNLHMIYQHIFIIISVLFQTLQTQCHSSIIICVLQIINVIMLEFVEHNFANVIVDFMDLDANLVSNMQVK